MTYDMIQSTLTLIIEAAVCSLPVLWLHYLYSSGRCPKELTEVFESYPTGIRSLSESNTFGVRENFVEQSFGISLVLEQHSDKVFDTFHSDSEDIAVEHLSNSERIPSDTLSNSPRTTFGQVIEQPVKQSWLNRVKRYQLHGYEVVKVADVRGKIPAGVLAKRGALSAQRYRLRSQPVVRVQDLVAAEC